MEFSKEQAAVLAAQTGNRLVSAQAGAGKTRILVEDILYQVLDQRTGLDQMLIVTFTRKAAGEMKSRISQGLLDALKDPARQADRPWILSQLTNLSSANIQTLDAFCLEVVKAHYDRLGLDPGVHILDNKKLAAIQEEVMDELWEDLSSRAMSDPDLRDFLEAYGYKKRFSRDLLWDNIQAILTPMACQVHPDRWLADQEARMTQPDLTAFQQAAFASLLEEDVDSLLDEGLHLEGAMATVDLPEGLANQTLDLIHTIRRALTGSEEGGEAQALQDRARENIFAQPVEALAIDFGRISIKGVKQAGPEVQEFYQAIKESRDRWKAQLKSLRDNLPFFQEDHLRWEFQEMSRAFTYLFAICWTYLDRTQALKKEANGLDFHDCQMETLRLLEDPEVRKELQDRFVRIYFDEYQDSSRIQDQIINALSRGDNLFFVGDIKQSIYGFRQAEPENFKQRYQLYKTSPTDHALDMTLNFRTRPEILDFINFIFQDLMTEERGDACYDSPGHRSQAGRTFDGPGQVTLALLSKNPAALADDFWKDYGNQPFYVAQVIADHVAQGGKFSDCAILTRTNQAMIPYAIILDHFHIPLAADGQLSDAKHPDLAIAKALLKVIDNRQDDLALLTVLSSPIGGFSDADLARIRLGREDRPFAQAFLDFAGEGSLAEAGGTALSEEAQTFLQRVADWRMRLKEMPLDQFVGLVLEETGLLSFAGALPGGSERRLYLDSFLRRAQAYSQEEGTDLRGFLTYLDLVEGGGGEAFEPANPLSDQDNVVRIMTIHKAKGLEFPLLFLVESQSQFNDGDRQAMIVSDPDLGCAIDIRSFQEGEKGEDLVVHRPLLRRMLDQRRADRDRSEAVRLLYVAMTRAIDQLYIVGDFAEDKLSKLGEIKTGDLQAELDQGKSYQDWILAILRRSPLIRQAAAGDWAEDFKASLPSSFDRPLPAGTWTQAFTLLLEPGEKFRQPTSLAETGPEAGEEDWPTRLLAYRYPYEKETQLPIKKTVSQLSAKNQNKEENLKDWPSFWAKPGHGGPAAIDLAGSDGPEGWAPVGPESGPPQRSREVPLPRFLQKERSFSPAEWGTLMHRAMQLLPLEPYDRAGLTQALDRLEARGQFSPEERQALDEDKLLAFFQTELGQEIVGAKDHVHREQAFTLLYTENGETYAVDGQVDLYVWSPQGILLVDFKTDRRIQPNRYRKQLDLYSQALERAYQKPVVRKLIFWLSFGQWTDLSIKR